MVVLGKYFIGWLCFRRILVNHNITRHALHTWLHLPRTCSLAACVVTVCCYLLSLYTRASIYNSSPCASRPCKGCSLIAHSIGEEWDEICGPVHQLPQLEPVLSKEQELLDVYSTHTTVLYTHSPYMLQLIIVLRSSLLLQYYRH